MDTSRFIVEDFAAFVVNTRQFPADTLNEGKRILLDQLACQIATAPLPWSVSYLEGIRDLDGKPSVTVVYFGDRLPLDQAAFVNSAFGHGGEIDDTQPRSNNHSGAVVVPPVLAIAEQSGLTGREVLEALIVGAETMIRVGAAGSPHIFNRHHHVPAATGPFGSAAAVSRLLDLTEPECANAIAISGSHCGGHLEYTHTGGSVKRCHCGIASVSGLRSAYMAKNGITGPLSVFEGKRGFFNTFAGDWNRSTLTDGLGENYLLRDTAYKPFANPYAAHGCVEAFDTVVAKNDIEPEQIEAIEFATSAFTIKNVGTIKEPKSVIEAHFSLAFSCAVRLYRGGNGLYDYREEDLDDPRFLDIVHRVTMIEDPKADELRLKLNTRPASVKVTLKDGQTFEESVLYSKGNPKNPLSNDELTAKFRYCVVPRLGEERAEQIAEMVWAFEDVKNAGELVRLTLREN